MRHGLRRKNADFFLFLLMAALLVLGTISLAAFDLRGVQGRPGELEYPWAFFRDGEALRPEEQVVEIIAVGDIMLGRGVAGVKGVFSQSASWLRAADLVMGNFEGAIVVENDGVLDHGSNTSREVEVGGSRAGAVAGKVDTGYTPYQLLISPEAPETLRSAGFDLLSLANNHSLDAGSSGLQETTDRLEAAGLVPLAADTATYVLKENGLRVAFVALNLIPGSIVVDLDEAQAMIQSARKQADVVVVSVHWGLEYQLKPSPAQVQLADQMSQWGADLVLGHHPHVAQPLEILHQGEGNPQHETLVAYSLGNFVFDQSDERTRQGLALRALVDQEGLRAVQVLPVEAGLRPRLATLKDSNALLERVSPAPRRVGYACRVQGCWSTPVPQEERSGIFWADQIDMTGDGVPEVVKRVAQAVVIYQDGEPVWRSPPEWTVLDVVLGDPNDDGRAEVLLALNKPGPGGTLTSHPFILGYRGGSYRVLWGGSAVSDPLLEVELGDLDGDGVQELIVLDAPQGGNKQALSVWRWHGWGFSQLWRSPEGSYRDVILLPEEEGESSRISVVSLNGDANR